MAFNKANIREISPWDNNCLSACMADFIAAGLQSEAEISNETVEVLGEMVGKFYGTPKLTRKQLNDLFSAPYCFSPLDWQVILGVIFRDYIKQECAKDPVANAGVVDHKTQQMTPKGFDILAKKLNVNVECHILQNNKIYDAKTVAAGIPGLEDAPEYKELPFITVNPGSTLKVLYTAKHYNRLDNIDRVTRLNSLSNAINFQVDYRFTLPSAPLKAFTPDRAISIARDNAVDLKNEVKARIAEVQSRNVVTTPWDQVRFVVAPLDVLDVKPKASADRYHLFQSEVKQMQAELTLKSGVETEEAKLTKLVANTNGVEHRDAVHTIKYSLPTKELWVTEKAQKTLDEQLARKLQQDEVTAEAARVKQEEEDRALAVKLSSR